MPLTLEEFVDRVRSSGLPVAAELEGVVSALPAEQRPADGEQFAECLVRDQRLTRYQAEQLRDGHGRELVLGNYIVLEKLGQGGMGTVFKALHQRMERIVALKVLSPNVITSPDSVKRFQREVKTAARLEHPNIIAAFDADEANGTHFLVMQFVEGTDLSAYVRTHGPLPIESAVSCVFQAARGLDYAHGRGVIHRDIKPSNLLLDRAGNVRILDMGLARFETASSPLDELTTANQILGTVDYMAPEQASDSKHADHRADIYSLGATLWFLLTGRPLFEAKTVVKKLMAHQQAPIPSLRTACPQVSPALEAVFARMVAKSLADRWPSMSAVIDTLQAFPAVPLRNGEDVCHGLAPPSSAFEPTVTHIAPQSDTEPGTSQSLSRAQLIARESTVSLASLRAGSRWWNRRTLRIVGAIGVATILVSVGVTLLSGIGGGRKALDDAVSQQSPENRSPASGDKLTTPAIRPEDFGWPADAPALAIAPFDAGTANAHQQAWAKYLKMDVQITNDVGMTFRLIPPGDFLMGSTTEELRANDDAAIDQRPHRVQIRQPFLLGTQEVTLGQFRQFVEATGHVTEPERDGEGGMGWDDVTGKQVKRSPNYSWRQTGFPQTDEHPVTNISWNDAVAFCEWLSQLDHVTYELPTEAEWEYACRAGSTERFSFGDDDAELPRYGNFYDASTKAKLNNNPNQDYAGPRDGFPFTSPVGSFQANPFGLFDMHGNVWEVCSDLYHKDYDSEHGGPARSDRGGGWRNDPQFCRSGYRGYDPPSVRSYHSGLRVVRRLPSFAHD